MNLLYCDAGGIVFAVHDDGNAAVPMASYPTVVRIIPYDQPMTTLLKVGPPPSDPRYDTRQYQQPDPTPALLKLYSGQCRFNYILKGFMFTAASGQVPVWTDRVSYSLINSLATWVVTASPTPTTVNYTQGGDHYLLTAAEATKLFNQFTAYVQKYRDVEAACITDLVSASPTILTYADVDARFSAALVRDEKTAERPLSTVAP
jgi:hypothetical protein